VRPRWGRRCFPGAPGDDQVLVADRVVNDGELKHPVEHHPAAAGAAAVEAEHEFVQVAGQVRVIHRALVGAQQPPLGQRGYPMYRWQQLAWIVASCPRGPLAAPVVNVAERVQPGVALPAVRDDPRARLDVILHERVQRSGRCIGQRKHPAPAESSRFTNLHRDTREDLLATSTTAWQPRL